MTTSVQAPQGLLRSGKMHFFMSVVLCLVWFACESHTTEGFYLPGIAPVDFRQGDSIEVLANRLTSIRNKLPFPYYSVPFCRVDPSSRRLPRSRPVNLGQMLIGERAIPTAYDLRMLVDVPCTHMCSVSLADIPVGQLRFVLQRIRQGYYVRLNADNMPLVTRGRTKTGFLAFHFGYKLGAVNSINGDVYINNHLKLVILYHKPRITSGNIEAMVANVAGSPGSSNSEAADKSEDYYRVVGFEVHPRSIAHNSLSSGNSDLCAAVSNDSGVHLDSIPPQVVRQNETVAFTYSVEFRQTDQPWATRWDPILAPNDEVKQIQWFSIVNSIMVGLFLTVLVAFVMLRTVLRDFAHYQRLDENIDGADFDDVTGWKLLHGDVFRPPQKSGLLAVCVGSGAQVFVMTACTLVLALMGLLSPANRGSLLSALIMLFVLASVVAGYVSARAYAFMEYKTSRRRVTWGAAFLFPGISFTMFLLLNILVSFTGSSGAVPFMTLFLLFFLWLGLSVPLVFTGAYVGYLRKPASHPVRTNQIPRQIPRRHWLFRPAVYVPMGGLLPFGSIFMELVFSLNAVSQGSIYYFYGALMAVLAVLVVTCAELSIVFTYMSLASEDWNWAWQSFCTTAFSGIYMFAYSVYYLASQPAGDIGEGLMVISFVLYSTYMAIVSGAFSLMCGFIGYTASRWFVRHIYGAIRVD